MRMLDKYATPINQQIKASTILLIPCEFNTTARNISRLEAQKLADVNSVDLIQIGNGDIPACKLQNYKKYLFEQKKSASKSNDKPKPMKEIQLKPRIDSGDYKTKLNRAIGFLLNKHQVKASLFLKGREKAYKQQHIDNVLMKFLDELSDYAKVVVGVKSDSPNKAIVIIAPKLQKENKSITTKSSNNTIANENKKEIMQMQKNDNKEVVEEYNTDPLNTTKTGSNNDNSTSAIKCKVQNDDEITGDISEES